MNVLYEKQEPAVYPLDKVQMLFKKVTQLSDRELHPIYG